MKRIYLVIITLIMISISIMAYQPVFSVHNEAGESFVRVQKVIEKTKTKKFERKIEKIVKKAKNYAEKHYKEDAAIVSDIDDTLLRTYGYFDEYKVFNKEDWSKWIKKNKVTPIMPTIKFLQWAKQKGYKIYLISGRLEETRPSTEVVLKKYDIPYDKLFLKSKNYDKPSAVPYKSSIREMLSEKGNDIILSIGDQKSDYLGGFGKGFKLPNPVYTVP